MDIKKLVMIALAAGTMTLAAACGDDNDNGGGKPDGDVPGECSLEGPPAEAVACDLGAGIEPTACDEDGDAEQLVVQITEISIPARNDLAGFNLDCVTTTATDEFGCGKADGAGGIDNGLAQVNFYVGLASRDLNEIIGEGIEAGHIGFRVVIDGWNGTADDSCVTLGLQVLDGGDYVDAGESVQGVVEGGVVKALVPALPLVIPFESDEGDLLPLAVSVQNAPVELTLSESGDVTSGLLGGHVLWDDGSDTDLLSLVEEVSKSIDIPGLNPVDLVRRELDVYIEGDAANTNACECAALSVGLRVAGERLGPPV